jgi:hypothetical protein
MLLLYFLKKMSTIIALTCKSRHDQAKTQGKARKIIRDNFSNLFNIKTNNGYFNTTIFSKTVCIPWDHEVNLALKA